MYLNVSQSTDKSQLTTKQRKKEQKIFNGNRSTHKRGGIITHTFPPVPYPVCTHDFVSLNAVDHTANKSVVVIAGGKHIVRISDAMRCNDHAAVYESISYPSFNHD